MGDSYDVQLNFGPCPREVAAAVCERADLINGWGMYETYSKRDQERYSRHKAAMVTFGDAVAPFELLDPCTWSYEGETNGGLWGVEENTDTFALLAALGIPYVASDEAKYEHPGSIVWWRPGMESAEERSGALGEVSLTSGEYEGLKTSAAKAAADENARWPFTTEAELRASTERHLRRLLEEHFSGPFDVDSPESRAEIHATQDAEWLRRFRAWRDGELALEDLALSAVPA